MLFNHFSCSASPLRTNNLVVLREPLSNGIYVFDLLIADVINDAALRSAHRQLLAAARPRLMAAEHTRATQAIKALKPAFERLAQNEARHRAKAP